MTEYGAKMERGIVSSVTDAGAVIRSIDRPGIVTPPLKRMDGTLPENGEVVWFYMTDDGQGAVAGSGETDLSKYAKKDDLLDYAKKDGSNATGTWPIAEEVLSTDIDGLVVALHGKPGQVGSVLIKKKSEGIGSEIAPDWYNYFYAPHRRGIGGDNPYYGTIILTPMTSDYPAYIVRHSNSADHATKVKRILTDLVSPSNGGTGQTTLANSLKALTDAAGTGDAAPHDDDWFLAQWAGGGTDTTPVRRKISALWEYIKSKLSSVTGVNISGNAHTADNAHTVDNFHFFSDTAYPYKKTITVDQPEAGKEWYLRIKSYQYTRDVDTINIKASGNNRTGMLVIHLGARGDKYYGYATHYNFVGVTGTKVNHSGEYTNLFLKIDPTCTQIYITSTQPAVEATFESTTTGYDEVPSYGGLFSNQIQTTSLLSPVINIDIMDGNTKVGSLIYRNYGAFGIVSGSFSYTGKTSYTLSKSMEQTNLTPFIVRSGSDGTFGYCYFESYGSKLSPYLGGLKNNHNYGFSTIVT